MIKKLLVYIAGAGLGLWLATEFISGIGVQSFPDSNFFGIALTKQWHLFILFGVILGLLNFFVKPILGIITLPLKIITLGLFGIIVNMGLIWIVDTIFKELTAPLFYPLLWTTIIIWVATAVLSAFLLRED